MGNLEFRVIVPPSQAPLSTHTHTRASHQVRQGEGTEGIGAVRRAEERENVGLNLDLVDVGLYGMSHKNKGSSR